MENERTIRIEYEKARKYNIVNSPTSVSRLAKSG